MAYQNTRVAENGMKYKTRNRNTKRVVSTPRASQQATASIYNKTKLKIEKRKRITLKYGAR